MEVLKLREIVIEYERVQSIRKRARTQVARCGECHAEADFVTIGDAADLFNTETERLTVFIAVNKCHSQTDSAGRVFVCIGSLLAKMRDAAEGPRLPGETMEGK